MKSMDKISTGIAYGTSAGSAGYWFLQWLDRVSPSQWAAIGVLGSLVLGFLTYRHHCEIAGGLAAGRDAG
ncbi:class II holin family protein [Escherichia coli]|uniref:class II holin family protein n=1 Tax=Escherichia coli TaxID=562 RepID=UPI001CC0C88D|nr:class II holin family protein [Escherichia coli]HDX7023049.1 class II holin family protein [Escherichia coli]